MSEPGIVNHCRNLLQGTGYTVVPRVPRGARTDEATIEAAVDMDFAVLAMTDQPIVPVEEDGYHEHTGVPCRTCVLLGAPVVTVNDDTVSEGFEDGGRISRGGWHYPYCWRGWVYVGMPLEGDCECETEPRYADGCWTSRQHKHHSASDGRLSASSR